jgi:hypothetical protein
MASGADLGLALLLDWAAAIAGDIMIVLSARISVSAVSLYFICMRLFLLR